MATLRTRIRLLLWSGVAATLVLLGCGGEGIANPNEIGASGLSARAQVYLDGALDIVSETWMFRDQVDWEARRAVAIERSQGAVTERDTWPAIRELLATFDDVHSRLATGQVANLRGAAGISGAAATAGPRIVAERIGVIPIGATGAVGADGNAWARERAAEIRGLQSQGACGWVVDLRDNAGGNMWAMVAGVGSLLGEGQVGSFVDPVDGESLPWIYTGGQARLEEEVAQTVPDPPVFAEAPPVAVLTGFTVSAGEAVAVAFAGRSETRLFGQPTWGAANAPAHFELSDGAVLWVAEYVYADRTGREYGRKVVPDEVIEGLDTGVLETDAALARAVEWLMSREACASG